MERRGFCSKRQPHRTGRDQGGWYLRFSKLYLGKMYVKEITPPEGYTVDPTEYEVDLAYEGQEVAEVTRDLTVQEQVKSRRSS